MLILERGVEKMIDDADKPEIQDPEIVAMVQKILAEVKSAETNNVNKDSPSDPNLQVA